MKYILYLILFFSSGVLSEERHFLKNAYEGHNDEVVYSAVSSALEYRNWKNVKKESDGVKANINHRGYTLDLLIFKKGKDLKISCKGTQKGEHNPNLLVDIDRCPKIWVGNLQSYVENHLDFTSNLTKIKSEEGVFLKTEIIQENQSKILDIVSDALIEREWKFIHRSENSVSGAIHHRNTSAILTIRIQANNLHYTCQGRRTKNGGPKVNGRKPKTKIIHECPKKWVEFLRNTIHRDIKIYKNSLIVESV